MLLTLQQIVQTDPDTAGYSSMSDADIEYDIKDKRKQIRKPVPFGEYQQFLFDNGVVLAVMMAINDTSSPAHGTAILVNQMLQFGAERLSVGVDMDNPGNDSLFDAMVSTGLMTAAVRAAMELLGDSPASLADINELPAFTHIDIAKITGGTN